MAVWPLICCPAHVQGPDAVAVRQCPTARAVSAASSKGEAPDGSEASALRCEALAYLQR
jgi:hypothetical protein